ncbi:unnamed protein product [Hermetia illucens]|uniref:Uncharacterized protein n=1 Tax=Hermetia illucens TaxID=343691 RepID=A0A7R8UIT3_HERIL|nr:putative mediator of RNA polymerase II transcription subunit 12 [Hermetia illucens]CAD7081647.1 unnamed protein product [Hermetia illucens]
MPSVLWVQLFIGIFVITSAENVAREAKEKRQIHQTGVASQHNQDVHRQLDAIYGSASPYLVRAAAPKVQRSQPQVHYQPQQQLQEIQLDQAQLQAAQFPYYADVTQSSAQPHVQTLQQSQATQYYPQAAPGREQQPQFHTIREEQLFKLLQDELAARNAQPEPAAAQTQQKPKGAPTTPGLGNYREAPQTENGQRVQYIQYPQNYIQPNPLDYHRSLPNHPLAQSSLEKEIEKLVASNKPDRAQGREQEVYRSQKLPPKLFSTTPAPVQEDKPYPDVPDLLQFNNFKPQSPLFYQQNLADPTPQYPIETPEQYQKLAQINQNAGQYLIGANGRPKFKPNHSPFQHQQYYQQEAKDNIQSQTINAQGKGNALQVIPSPNLQYETPEASPSPDAAAYFKAQNFEKQRPQISGQSHSAIYVAQGTGVTPIPHQQQLQQQPVQQKQVPKLPEQGKVITEAEFQALVDAGYPVEAVPVPVPVPVPEPYGKGAPPVHLLRPQPQKGFRRQVKPGPARPGVTFLRPLRLVNPDAHGRQ